MRTDQAFSTFYQGVLKELTDEPVHLAIEEYHYTTPEDRYHHAYFHALEVCGELENRFDQSDLAIICEMEAVSECCQC